MGILVKIAGKKLEDVRLYLESAVDHIIKGDLIAFPTDSVYGMGGDPLNLDLIERIKLLKFRDHSKGFLLLVADLEEAKKIAEFNPVAEALANQFWPGQLTLILKKKEESPIPPEISPNRATIGLRVPENPIILELLRLLKVQGTLGVLIGTSANYSGEPPATSGDEIAKIFMGAIDFIIDGGKSKSQQATTIVDCTSEEIQFPRIGKIKKEKIVKYLKNIDPTLKTGGE